MLTTLSGANIDNCPHYKYEIYKLSIWLTTFIWLYEDCTGDQTSIRQSQIGLPKVVNNSTVNVFRLLPVQIV